MKYGLALGLIAIIVALIAGVVYLNGPPQTTNTSNVLSFTYSVSNNTYTFYAPDGYTNYVWDFGDSSTGAGAIVSHTYQMNGDYKITLTANPANDSGPLSAFQQILVNTVTTLVHHYFENLNVTMGNSAT